MTREEAIGRIKTRFDKWALDDEDMKAIKTLIPELAESEDERIRKRLIEYFEGFRMGNVEVRWEGLIVQEVLAWLEKQKERVVDSSKTSADEDERIREAIESTIRVYGKTQGEWIGGYDMDTLVVHLREAFSTLEKQKEQKPKLEVFGFKVGDAVRLKDGDGRKHIIKSFEEVEGLHGPNFYHVEFEDNQARCGIYPGKKYPNGYYTQMEKFEDEQKPAGWNEEDEKMCLTCIDIMEHFPRPCGEVIGPWKDCIDWLKSLRPQPHTVSIKNATKFGNLEYERGVKDGIQSEKSRQWKPSEEQMDALRASNSYWKGTTNEVPRTDLLESLYNDLEKLIAKR